MDKNATDQASDLLDENGKFKKGNMPPTGFHTNPERRNSGGWIKSDTPRYKLEQMMKLNDDELKAVIADKDQPTFERKLATFIFKGDWKTLKEMTDQVYGQPKQTVETTIKEKPTPLLPKPKKKK